MAAEYPSAQVASVARLVEQRIPTAGSSRLISIDGPAGSGKTTLGRQLLAQFGAAGGTATMLHMDDFFAGWSGLDHARELETRVLDQVLRPLVRRRPTQWQRYDWQAGRLAEWHDLIPPEVLILEGCGSGALPYAPYVTVLVWVEARREIRLARGLRRDGDQVLPQWLRWMDSEARHFAANDTRGRADLRLCTG